jgi:hypothetical protein
LRRADSTCANSNRETIVSLTRVRVLAAPATLTKKCFVDDTESVASYRTLSAVTVGSVTTQ